MLSRRDIGKLSGSGLALALLGINGCKSAPHHVWSSEALGAPSFIKLQGLSAATAQAMFKAAEIEIIRLAAIFSLYNSGSEISKLNQNGGLTNASPELIEVLHAARKISELTNGAFDITVQALWKTAEYLMRANVTDCPSSYKMAQI